MLGKNFVFCSETGLTKPAEAHREHTAPVPCRWTALICLLLCCHEENNEKVSAFEWSTVCCRKGIKVDLQHYDFSCSVSSSNKIMVWRIQNSNRFVGNLTLKSKCSSCE